MQYALYVLCSRGWMNPFLAYLNVVIYVKMDFGQMWKKITEETRKYSKEFRKKRRKKGENHSPETINTLVPFLAVVLELYRS